MRLRWPFPYACREKGHHGVDKHEVFMDLACACDVRFPLPVEEKALSGLSQKALGVLGGSARDGLSPLPVEEKAISGLPWKAPGGPPKCPGSSRGRKLQLLLTNVQYY